MLTSNDFTGLVNRRFVNNFFPIPATNILKNGSRPPDFELIEAQSQRSLRLSDYWGKQPVLLAFTRIFTEKQYCPLCFPHIVALNQAYEQFVERGVEVLMITSTDRVQSQTIIRDLDLKLPLLSDPQCQTFRAYQTGQALGAPLPAQFLLDREGKLQFRHLFSFLASNANPELLLTEVDKLSY